METLSADSVGGVETGKVQALKGKSASAGFVVGQVLVLQSDLPTVSQDKIATPELEIKKFEEALLAAKEELNRLKIQAEKTLGLDKAQIFDAHALILEDPELLDPVKNKILEAHVSAAWALQQTSLDIQKIFQQMDDAYLRERASDVQDVTDRVLRKLLGLSSLDLSVLQEEVVLVAHDLTPSQTATMRKEKVLGILTDIGGKTSHTAILARTLEIPAVLGLKKITSLLKTGDWVAFDGASGEVIPYPSASVVQDFKAKKEIDLKQRKELESLKGLETVTADGHKVHLCANIGTPVDIPALKKYDAEGVGLFRTEFLFMDRPHAPTEQEQFESYKAVLEAMGSKQVIIRTLDVGGDKEIPYLEIPKEENPFLGLRAIRYCLRHQEIFRTQLRAMLRASVYGNLGIMFPMISRVEEVLEAKKILAEVRQDLESQNLKIAENIQIGIMIEIPSAAVIADVFAKEVDFLSLGTNDLIQYTCAVDRMNQEISDLYDSYHPAVLRLIANVIDAGKRHNAWVGMCGEMASQTDLIPVLLGMGLEEFSQTPTAILKSRQMIRSLKLSEAEALAKEVLSLGTSSEIQNVIKKFGSEI